MPAAIETRQLSRVFREPGRWLGRGGRAEVAALRDVSLCIAEGECVALVGPNGAGKSTLLRVLATLVLPTSGQALVRGHDVVRDPASVRRAIGVTTGDERSFFWRLSGFENLRFFAELQGIGHREAGNRAWDLLEQVGLTAAAHRRFAGYSTGMRQRLGIARALLHRPPVLLLDEPTANLDIEHRRIVLDLVRAALAGGDVTALIVSHDAGLAATLAHRVVRLEQGRLAERGDAREPMHYGLRVRGLTAAQLHAFDAAPDGDTARVTVLDLGDGHALSAAVASIVAGGGEVLDVRAEAASEAPR